MTETSQTTIEDSDGLLEAFEGQVSEEDITESLSSEEVFTRLVTSDELDGGVMEATITRIDVGDSVYDRTAKVCKVYYEISGIEWVFEVDLVGSMNGLDCGSSSDDIM